MQKEATPVGHSGFLEEFLRDFHCVMEFLLKNQEVHTYCIHLFKLGNRLVFNIGDDWFYVKHFCITSGSNWIRVYLQWSAFWGCKVVNGTVQKYGLTQQVSQYVRNRFLSKSSPGIFSSLLWDFKGILIKGLWITAVCYPTEMCHRPGRLLNFQSSAWLYLEHAETVVGFVFSNSVGFLSW